MRKTSSKAPILVVLPSVTYGGAELQTMMQIRALRTREVPVKLMILSNVILPEVLEMAELSEDCVCRLGGDNAALDRKFLKSMFRLLSPAVALVRNQSIRKIVAHLPPAHIFVRLIFLNLLLQGRRVDIFQYHHSEQFRQSPPDTFSKRLFHTVNALVGRLCDRSNIFVSEASRADFTGYTYAKNPVVVTNAVDPDKAVDKPGAEAVLCKNGAEGRYTILFAGRLHPTKGHEMFVETFARFLAEEEISQDDIRVLIVGAGSLEAELRNQIGALGLNESVRLIGVQPNPVLLALFAKVDLVVMPSLSEGLPISALEALICGAQLLASDAGGLAEVIRHGENGYKFPAGDGEALSALLRQVWRQGTPGPIDRRASRDDCIEKYSHHRQMDLLLDLIENDGKTS